MWRDIPGVAGPGSCPTSSMACQDTQGKGSLQQEPGQSGQQALKTVGMQPAQCPDCVTLTADKHGCLTIVQVPRGRQQPLDLLILKGHVLSMEQHLTSSLHQTHLRIGDVKWV